MSDIFISYATEDRERAHQLAEVLGARGWSVWWDRKIPLGQTFDEVIEKALAEARCAIVLWSAVSVTSEWVRNEASEARRRGILVPVFLEAVNAPLAFRLLNGANLCDWSPGSAHGEFDKLVERVTELLGQEAFIATPSSSKKKIFPQQAITSDLVAQFFKSRLVRGGLGMAVVVILAVSYVLRMPQSAPEPAADIAPIPRSTAPAPVNPGDSDIEKAIKDLTGAFGGAIPATSLAKGFHVPDLGFRVAFLTPEQSASTLGAMPPGAVVLEIESGRPMARAGLQAGDLIVSIGGKRISSENDLRQAILKIGPGKTEYSFRRGSETKSVAVDCPNCKAE
ncbi:MAG TPA: TIR domain-containing protein [Candidatus Limnocylindria bacterium]|nr:TIR domain-containing protein [Candidatus Limnocylindria bacterium]